MTSPSYTPQPGDLRALAALLVLLGLILVLAILAHIGRSFMKRLPILAALAATALMLSACGSTGLFVSPPGASQATTDALTKAKGEADGALVKALADKLAHCGLTGTVSVGLGGLAATGTGFANTMQLTCPGMPYTAADFPSVTTFAQMAAGPPAAPAAAPK